MQSPRAQPSLGVPRCQLLLSLSCLHGTVHQSYLRGHWDEAVSDVSARRIWGRCHPGRDRRAVSEGWVGVWSQEKTSSCGEQA